MGAATKVLGVFKVTEDAPTPGEDAAYTATTKVGEGAYLAITKLMNLDHVEVHHTTLHNEDTPPAATRFESGFRSRLSAPVTVDKNGETMPAPAPLEADDDSLLEPTNILAAPWTQPRLPIGMPTVPPAPRREIERTALPSTPTPTDDIPIIIDVVLNAPDAPHAPVLVSPPAASNSRELLVFAIAFFTTLLPAAIYLLAR